MRKLFMVSFALLVICGSAFAASADFLINSKGWESSPQNLNVINISGLSENDLNEIMLGMRPDVAVEFSAQTTLPITLFLKGDLINLLASQASFGDIEIQQVVYARVVLQELILSTNLVEWKPFLEFITGNISVSLTIQEGKPSIVVGAEVNQRS
ncbi:MAG: hypothetical protein WCG42_03940 [Parachlamydiaceae bacterium]